MGQTSSVRSTRKFLGYAAGFALIFWHLDSVKAQNFELLTPEQRKPKQPSVLPTVPNPFKTMPSPPVPGSILDVPGTITVQQYKFAGNTVFSSRELNQAIADFTGKPISFAQLVQAARQITEFYVSRGYITTGAYVPEQSLASGTVQIQIVEGSLAEIEVHTTGKIRKNYVRDRIASRVKTPLNINQLQSALQLLQLNPLVDSLNAELSAGFTPGTNILKISVNSADTFSLQTQLNNNRNLSIGTFERSLQLEEANLTGIGDRLNLAYDNTEGSNQFGGSYSLPFNSHDGSLEFNFRWGQNAIVQSSFEEIDIDINSRNYDLTWRQPVLQKATPEVSQELALNLSAGSRASKSTIMNEPQPVSLGANEAGEIRTTVLSFGQEWLQRNRRQVISARSQFNLGVDFLDATILNEEPDSKFFSWRGQFSYLRSLSKPEQELGVTMLLRSELQLSADALISTEQFSLGGATTVRGYRQDALLTDNGFLATAEFRLPLVRFEPINATLQLAPFVDWGTGWNNGENLQETEFNTLIGTGFGLLLQSPEKFSARVDWGVPLINHDDRGSSWQENGVYFQLQYDLL